MTSFADLKQKFIRALNRNLCRIFYRRDVPLPEGRFVTICFDDFPKSSAETASAMLEKRGWRATWYVVGSFEGAVEPNLGEMYDQNDLKKLHQNDHDIATHTFDHLDCTKINHAEISDQWVRNEKYLRTRGIGEVSSFAYPFGEVSLAAKRQHAKYNCALRGTNPGLNQHTVDLNLLKACGIQDNLGGIARAKNELEKLSREDGWLIIFTHDVRDAHSPWGVSPEVFDTLLSQVEKSGAEVITVAGMMRRLEYSSASALSHFNRKF